MTTSTRRPPGRNDPCSAGGRDAKRLAATILEVLAGARTPTQAAQSLSVSLPRYYQLEQRAMAGLVTACEPRPKGRQRGPLNVAAALGRENDRLRKELNRQQALVRMAQRSVGLSPPPPPKPKSRKRKPATRALAAAARLRASEEDQPAGATAVES
jgi:hypothetical protein